MMQGKKIANKIKAGDLEAFQAFYQCYFKRLYNYAVLFTNQSDVAEDVVQEAFFKIWDKRKSIDCNQSLSAFLYKTVRNLCLNTLKQQKVHDKFIDFAQHFEAIDNVYKHDFELTESPDDLYVYTEIKKAISELPDKRQKVFKLSKLDGQSHNDISKQLNISTKGVERHITLANKTLQSKLKHLKTAIFVLALLP